MAFIPLRPVLLRRGGRQHLGSGATEWSIATTPDDAPPLADTDRARLEEQLAACGAPMSLMQDDAAALFTGPYGPFKGGAEAASKHG